MSRVLYNLIRGFSARNEASAGAPSRSAFDRDPKKVRAKRVGYQIGGASGGASDSFEFHDVDLGAIAESIRRDAYLTQGVMKYEELVFKSGWRLKSKNEQALEYIKHRLDVMAVATGIPTEEFFTQIARDIVWASNCFIVKARAKNGVGLPPGVNLQPVPPSKDPVAGYFVLPPQTIEIARDEHGEVVKYRQEAEGGGDEIEFNPEDIIHIKVNTRSGRAFGDPWLAPVIEDVRLLRKVEENAALLLYKHIFPSLKYKVGLDKSGFEATDEEIESVEAMLEGMEEDSVYILPERHDIDSIKVNAIDGNPYLQYFENRVFSGMGLSQVDFGRGDTANRNTADAMTGQKADRIKGWQKIIQAYIDNFIIDELLIEGGYDPVINPEYDVDFVFNEIELEAMIKSENHELQKFNNNMQTWEETRANLGLDPSADEGRLHYNMIGSSSKSDAGKNSVDSQNQPENQNGKTSGPKRATEREANTYRLSESSKEEHLSKEVSALVQFAYSKYRKFYQVLKEDIISKAHESKMSYPIESVTSSLLVNKLQEDSLADFLAESSIKSFNIGFESSSREIGKKVVISKDHYYQIIKDSVEEINSSFIKSLNTTIEGSVKNTEGSSDCASSIASAFKANEYKIVRNIKTVILRSYNYGYAIRLLVDGQEMASVFGLDECEYCEEMNRDPLLLSEYSSLSSMFLYHLVPPWHFNCECQVVSFKGGEM